LPITPISTAATGGSTDFEQDETDVWVMFDLGTAVHWARVETSFPRFTINGWNATVEAGDQLGLVMDYTVHPTFGAYLNGVEGIQAPDDYSWWWAFYTWNLDTETWQTSMTGAPSLELDGGSAIAWAPSSIGTPLATPLDPYPWVSFRNGAQGLGVGSGPAFTPGDIHETAWDVDLDVGALSSTPVVIDGIVHLMTQGVFDWTNGTLVQPPEVVALDLTDGSELWRTHLDGQGWETGGVAVSQTKVYTGTTAGKVYALDRTTQGSQLWNVSVWGEITAPPTVIKVTEGWSLVERVLVASRARVDLLYSNNGSSAWTFEPEGPAADLFYFSSPSVVGNKAYIGAKNGVFYCLNLTDGTEIWNTSVGDEVRSTALVLEELVLFTNSTIEGFSSVNGHLLALNLSDNGSLEWSVNISASPSSPSFLNDTTIVVGSQAGLNWVDISGQKLLSLYNGPSVASPAVADEAIFYTTNSVNGGLEVATRDGVGSEPLTRSAFNMGSPVIADGLVIFAGGDGLVRALRSVDLADHPMFSPGEENLIPELARLPHQIKVVPWDEFEHIAIEHHLDTIGPAATWFIDRSIEAASGPGGTIDSHKLSEIWEPFHSTDPSISFYPGVTDLTLDGHAPESRDRGMGALLDMMVTEGTLNLTMGELCNFTLDEDRSNAVIRLGVNDVRPGDHWTIYLPKGWRSDGEDEFVATSSEPFNLTFTLVLNAEDEEKIRGLLPFPSLTVLLLVFILAMLVVRRRR
jgi:outer membrane protein assembly factor BamB